ncbi:MAG: PadR family transcriptional regulator [Gemmatimonadota bacterium]
MSAQGPIRPAVFHILLALAEEDRHGLGIAEAIRVATDGSVIMGPGTLYRSLKEMARDGLIREVASPDQADDPRRRFYALTEEGLTAARAEAGRWARVVDVARNARVLPEST